MSDLSGRCACGGVTWRTSAKPLWSGHCHCESCRRACAAPFTSYIGLPAGTVDWEGTRSHYSSSEGADRSFCPTCGTQLTYVSIRWPDEIHLFAATLDDPDLFVPRAHFHFEEHLGWIKLDDGLRRFEKTADGS